MTDTKDIDWTKTCWWRRQTDTPCLKPATWRGPRSIGEYCEGWRACDEHRFKAKDHIVADIPLEEENDL